MGEYISTNKDALAIIISSFALALTLLQLGISIYKNRLNISLTIQDTIYKHDTYTNYMFLTTIENHSSSPVSLTKLEALCSDGLYRSFKLNKAQVFVRMYPNYEELDIPTMKEFFPRNSLSPY